MGLTPWALGFALAWVTFLLVEQCYLRRARAAVPTRILVTGTRGKSSLVRILVAGARVTEPSAWGKITGDVPTLLRPDGDRLIVRRGPARLGEQARILRQCRRHQVRCLVAEAMTISPELMKAEAQLLRPTVVALVNVRDDHQETLGEDVDLQRKAYLDSLPAHCRWVTRDPALVSGVAGQDFVPPRTAVLSRDSSLLAGLGSVQRELVLLADDVLAELGWNSEEALRAMVAVARPLNNVPRWLVWESRDFVFLDAFSANDTESLAHLWETWRQELGSDRPWSVILATRADRPLRTRRFCDWISRRDDVEKVFVTGSHRQAARWLLRRQGIPVEDLGDAAAAMAFREGEIPAAVRGNGPVLIGIGNSRGLGLGLRAGPSERGT
jgi:poly-gamma-glutamate synthase PgsB/CapB